MNSSTEQTMKSSTINAKQNDPVKLCDQFASYRGNYDPITPLQVCNNARTILGVIIVYELNRLQTQQIKQNYQIRLTP